MIVRNSNYQLEELNEGLKEEVDNLIAQIVNQKK